MSESPDKLEVTSNVFEWVSSQTTKWKIVAGLLVLSLAGLVFTGGGWFNSFRSEATIDHIRAEHERKLATMEREMLERKNQEIASLKKRVEELENNPIVTTMGIE